MFSYLLAFIYRKSTVAVALMAFLVLVLRLSELLAFDRHSVNIAISAYKVFAYAVFLVAGAWLIQRHLARFNIAVKWDAPQAARPLP